MSRNLPIGEEQWVEFCHRSNSLYGGPKGRACHNWKAEITKKNEAKECAEISVMKGFTNRMTIEFIFWIGNFWDRNGEVLIINIPR